MDLAPLTFVAGLCLAFTLLLFFLRAQVELRSVAVKRGYPGGPADPSARPADH
jgi:hypothetical protein